MAEQFIFIILSIVLFCIVFFKMIKNNDTGYVPLLAIEALGITIDFILLISNKKINLIVKFLIYFMSVILPAIVIFLEKKNINIMSNMKMFRVNFYIAIGNYKKAKAILLRLTEQYNEVYAVAILHPLTRQLCTGILERGGIRIEFSNQLIAWPHTRLTGIRLIRV